MAKPRTLVLDPQKFGDKFLSKWKKEITKSGGAMAESSVIVGGNSVFIMIEHNLGNIVRDWEADVHSTDYCKVVRAEDQAGSYDWKANVYIKDCSLIEFLVGIHY